MLHNKISVLYSIALVFKLMIYNTFFSMCYISLENLLYDVL